MTGPGVAMAQCKGCGLWVDLETSHVCEGLAQMREQALARVDHACVWCSLEIRDLFASAFNACNAVEAATRGGGGWDRAQRKVAELRETLTRHQPAIDAHFAALGMAPRGETPT